MNGPATLSETDKRLLREIQWGFPLVGSPYGQLAGKLGMSPDEARAAVLDLRRRGIVRRIGASYVAERLGYLTTLVAVRVEARNLEQVAACVGDFREVTHNYQRDHSFNLWFTIVAPSRRRLDSIVATVAATSGIRNILVLPAVRTFKLRVEFAFGESGASRGEILPRLAADATVRAALPLSASDRRLIARTCGDLGLGLHPFADLAAELDLPEAELLARLETYKQAGAMRRFGAILRHRVAGFAGNGMSVWNVPEERIGDVAAKLAARPEVSHCYQRKRLPGWAYNLYGMVHCHSERQVRELVGQLARETGVDDYSVLVTLREFKKNSMVYFESHVPHFF